MFIIKNELGFDAENMLNFCHFEAYKETCT